MTDPAECAGLAQALSESNPKTNSEFWALPIGPSNGATVSDYLPLENDMILRIDDKKTQESWHLAMYADGTRFRFKIPLTSKAGEPKSTADVPASESMRDKDRQG